MNKAKATIMRDCIINQYKAHPQFLEAINKLGKPLEEWALSIDDIAQYDNPTPEILVMVQFEKLAKLMGASDKEAKSIAIETYHKNTGVINNDNYND
jgi:hypothetical protein